MEVIFGKQLPPDSTQAQQIAAFAKETEGKLLTEDDLIVGIQTTERDYVQFLKSLDVKKKTIDGFRGALDDSKRAVRRRMRGR